MFSKLTRGFTRHAMYVPLFMATVTAIFWITVFLGGKANSKGMKELADRGWLFSLSRPSNTTDHHAWNYWRLFDFSLVNWHAIGSATGNILLLVTIGTLNLPIFIPAMAIMLKQPRYNMNWELIGHGISNILSGATGSLPNLVVLANARLFTFAGGGRPEALIVTAFTVILFFISDRLLPLVPTILAAILVLFLGLDLLIEAVWSSANELLWCEWLVVVGTLIACTWAGFLSGFGIGISMALISHFLWTTYDSVSL